MPMSRWFNARCPQGCGVFVFQQDPGDPYRNQEPPYEVHDCTIHGPCVGCGEGTGGNHSDGSCVR